VNKYDKQFIFVAATVPTTGRKSVLAWFQRKNRDLFGKTLYISTDGTSPSTVLCCAVMCD
jgi:hypothetical protein